MGAYDAPPPRVLGVYSLASAVKVTVIVHALVCFFVISTASSVVEFRIGDLKVSTNVQIFAASWCVLGVAILVGAYLGIDAKQEWPLRAYFYYLALTTLTFSAALVYVVSEADHCDLSRDDHTSQRVGSDFACGLVSLLLFMVVLAFLALSLYITHIVWQLKEFLNQREATQHLHLDEDIIEAKMRKGGSGKAGYGTGSAGFGNGSASVGHLSLADLAAGGSMDEDVGIEAEEQKGMLNAMGFLDSESGTGPGAFHGAGSRLGAAGPEWAAAPLGVQPGWGKIPIRSCSDATAR